jgi:hypothetical protein
MKTKLLSMLAVGCLTAPIAANAAYWSLFNIEGEGSVSAEYVTYTILADMLGDTNRTGVFVPNAAGVGRNIVGSGSSGTTYWSLFNNEGESSVSAEYVTYATLADMLGDTNRTGVFVPNAAGVGHTSSDRARTKCVAQTFPNPTPSSCSVSPSLDSASPGGATTRSESGLSTGSRFHANARSWPNSEVRERPLL